MKVCGSCLEQKSIEHFHKNAKHNDGRSSVCITCTREYGKNWYNVNAVKRKQQVATRKQAIAQEISSLYLSLKSKPCLDCKQKFPPCAMDFDHVKGIKLKQISDMINGAYSVAKIKEEMNKCEVVCACCHRIRTERRRLEKQTSGRSSAW